MANAIGEEDVISIQKLICTLKFSPNYLEVTVEVGEDVIPFNSLEVLLKFVKHASMKGRPLLSSQIQLYSLHLFKKFFPENGHQMTTKVFENILLNYLFMVLTMKQTAHGLVPEDIAVQLGEEVMEPWVLPPTASACFQAHLENMSLTPLGLQAAQDFYVAHLPSWTESRGYLPGK